LALYLLSSSGGNKGIGKAICQMLLEKYPDVHVILGSRNEGRGNDAVKDITSSLGTNKCHGRLEVLQMDTSSDESVRTAADRITGTLYGIVNNAGVHSDSDIKLTVGTNYLGPKRVSEALLDKLERPGGRIVNISSASAPMFVQSCTNQDLVAKLSEPWTISGGIQELDEISTSHHDENVIGSNNAYGYSKALLSAYTWLFARDHPDLIVNAITPGFINTDMTSGWGATNSPEKGAIPPVWLLMSDELTKVPTGRYYGSDCKRSPWNVYRGPGDPVYEGPDGK